MRASYATLTDETEQILEGKYGDTEGLCDRHGSALRQPPDIPQEFLVVQYISSI
jgi:hypothetical protein